MVSFPGTRNCIATGVKTHRRGACSLLMRLVISSQMERARENRAGYMWEGVDQPDKKVKVPQNKMLN